MTRAASLLIMVFGLAPSAWAQDQQRPSDNPPQAPGERPRPVRRTPDTVVEINTHWLEFRGASLRGGWFAASDLDQAVPDAFRLKDNGFGGPPDTVRLEYHDMTFRAPEYGISADFDLVRLSLDGFAGHWDGHATLFTEDGRTGTSTQQELGVDGKFYGLKGSLYWPALRLRSVALELSLGPDFGVAWFHEDVNPIRQSPLPLDDRINEMVGIIGPRVAVRFKIGRAELMLEGEYPYLFSSSRGWAKPEGTFGFGYRF